MFRFPRFGTPKRKHRSSPSRRAQANYVRSTMAKRPPVSDITRVMEVVPAFDPNGTIERATTTEPVPPSKRSYPEAAVPVAEYWRAPQRGAVITDAPSETQFSGESSYYNLAAYSGPDRGVVHNAAVAVVDRPYFRKDPDASPYGDSLRSFFDRWGVIGADAPPRPGPVLDTSIYATVAASQFPAATQTRKQAAR